jgi:signal peptidase I
MDAPTTIEAARAAHLSAGERLSAALWPALRLVAAALAIALVVRILIAQPFAIPSGSMAPTLEPGDFVAVDKRAYGWSLASLPLAAPLMRPEGMAVGRLGAKAVEPGDVIAFVGPDGRDYVKRVVAVGGDRVSLQGGVLHLNGRAFPCVPETAGQREGQLGGLCRETLPNGQGHLIRSNGTGPTATFPELLVPDGHYFVLGDNRDESADSRVPRSDGGVGLVPDAQVMGRAARIFLSVDGGIRWDRVGRAID